MYDSLILGPVSLDINIDCTGKEHRELGGAVVASGYAAGRCGFKTAVLTKANLKEAVVRDRFSDSHVDLFCAASSHTCSIQNRYLTPDKEKRICTSLGVCDAITEHDLNQYADVEASVYHFGGLVAGDFDERLFERASRKGLTAVDAQGVMRQVQPDRSMKLEDWKDKKKYLPLIHFFKADAAEAQILTGTDDRKRAAEIIAGWGAQEVVFSHHTGILVSDGKKGWFCPIRARNLSGRTGRGDTIFAGYVNERLRGSMREALLFAAALVSLKMETPGPFMQTRADVEQYIREFYPDSPLQSI